MTYRLFIDDVRNPPNDTFTVARTVQEVKDIITERGFPTFISFDHDLGGDETGMQVANWLVDLWVGDDTLRNTVEVPHFTVHSMNPVGAANIRGLMQSWHRYADRFRDEPPALTGPGKTKPR